jgi:hypothetical protein
MSTRSSPASSATSNASSEDMTPITSFVASSITRTSGRSMFSLRSGTAVHRDAAAPAPAPAPAAAPAAAAAPAPARHRHDV